MKLSRYASLPWILSIPVIGLGVLFTVLYILYALLPGDFEPEMMRLGILFYSFFLSYVLLAVPLMTHMIRKSKRNIVIFESDRVELKDAQYLLTLYDLYYYPVTVANYLRYRPGLLILRRKTAEWLTADDPVKDVEVGIFNRREILRLTEYGICIQLN